MPISSSLSESLGNDPNVVYSLVDVPPNVIDSTHWKAACTSNTFLKNTFIGKALITSNNGNAPNKNGNVPLLPPQLVYLVILQKANSVNRRKEKTRKTKKTLITYTLHSLIRLIFPANYLLLFLRKHVSD